MLQLLNRTIRIKLLSSLIKTPTPSSSSSSFTSVYSHSLTTFPTSTFISSPFFSFYSSSPNPHAKDTYKPLIPLSLYLIMAIDHHHHNNNNNNQSLPHLHITNHKDNDFIAELTHHTPHSYYSQSSWEESPEGSSHDPSSPATSQECSWKSSYDMFGMFEKMNLHQTECSNHYPCHQINHQSSESSTHLCSYQSLIQQQIRAIELSRAKQDQVVVSPKAKGVPYESKQKAQQFPKKGNGRRARPPRPGPQQGGSGMRAVFLDGPGSRGGTGVFLPRAGGPTVPSQSTNKQGKGCSSVLIPARVVQALQLHFHQMAAATSGPKAPSFPLLHDVLVSTRDGMYSLEKRDSQHEAPSLHNDMVLPQEWTY